MTKPQLWVCRLADTTWPKIKRSVPTATVDERDLLNHISRWGSDGYPIKRVGSRHWSWSYRDTINTPAVYKTKREAIASFEAYHAMLLDRLAGRV